MKGCKVFAAVFLAGMVLLAQAPNRIVLVPATGQVFVGNEVRLNWEPVSQPDNFSYQWQLLPNKTLPGNQSSLRYTVKEPGMYRIRCNRSDGKFAEIQVMVRENRSVEMFPRKPFAGESVNLETRNFNTTTVKWDLGDGTILTGGQKLAHTYMQPGIYMVKAYDFAGDTKTAVEKRVRVERDNRFIETGYKVLYTGIPITLKAVNFQGQTIKWIFGDGQTAMTSAVTSHVFSRTGTIRVQAVDYAGRGDIVIEKSVQLQPDNRQLRLSADPISGEVVDISLDNVQPGSFEWSFSDGKRLRGSSVSGKLLGAPGPLTVTVDDPSKQYPPFNETVVVQPDVRSLEFSSDIVVPGEELVLEAKQFKGPGVKWLFGNGTVEENAPQRMTKAFQETGVYRITAIDFNGRSRKEFSKNVQVKEITPGFRIQRLEFVFRNGKYYSIVNRKGAAPTYRLQILAQGRGILKGKWLLDGAVIGLFEVQILEKKTVILDNRFMAKLPVVDAGLHRFTFQFTNYAFNGDIPMLRYFVAETPALRVVQPVPGAKLGPVDEVVLKWLGKQKGTYEVAVSEIPFQFLPDTKIKWIEVGRAGEYRWDLTNVSKKGWLYWHVRQLDAAGNVITTSDISSFKIDR